MHCALCGVLLESTVQQCAVFKTSIKFTKIVFFVQLKMFNVKAFFCSLTQFLDDRDAC